MAALALILPPEATRVIALRVSKEKDARSVRLSNIGVVNRSFYSCVLSYLAYECKQR